MCISRAAQSQTGDRLSWNPVPPALVFVKDELQSVFSSRDTVADRRNHDSIVLEEKQEHFPADPWTLRVLQDSKKFT